MVGKLTPSYKVAVPTLAGAIATLTAALIQHQAINPVTLALAGYTVGQAVLGYISPHKPIPLPHPPKRKPKPPAPAPQFTTVYDATSARAITAARVVTSSRDALAGYDDGLYNDVAAMRQAFPGHHVYSICVWASDVGDFLDNEPQNVKPGASPQERARLSVQWAEDRLKAGQKLTGLYADTVDWQLMDAELERRGISRKPRYQGGPIVRFIAQPTTPPEPHIPAGFDGCQYGFDGTYDASLFYTAALR